MQHARHLEVEAEVRYWEDATVGGVEDSDGTLIPFRRGEAWTPVIDLVEGRVVDWPKGTQASVHYKVCDAGLYWLQDGERRRIAQWSGHYVPNRFLCPLKSGYGDYIIMDIAADGSIVGWSQPGIDEDDWKPVR